MTDPTKQEVKQEEAKAPAFKPTPGMYKNVRGQKIFNAKGIPLKQTEGYFDPRTEEEKELCTYFERLGNLSKVK